MSIDQTIHFDYFSPEFEKIDKATKTCFHCQKAQLTCDGARPCLRCIKRDLVSTCTDSTTKKTKEPNLFATPISTANPSQPILINTETSFGFSLSDLGFGSETIGLEYGIISDMLQTPFLDMHQPMTTTKPTLFLNNAYTPSVKTSTSKTTTTPEEAYTSVKSPFNYAEGFHYLIQYVKEKMSKDDLMRISRALALVRPSFLTLIMNLTREDLVFMEKCLQRTLLEYEKLIRFSGTPTVVWRRTGEICLVGKEFLLLTRWTRRALLDKKKYIYELMDGPSAVEYWEKFALHAFDNTDKSCMSSCIIKTPEQKPVPCTFCFTIKRDIFDLPSVIVGNFLPILS